MWRALSSTERHVGSESDPERVVGGTQERITVRVRYFVLAFRFRDMAEIERQNADGPRGGRSAGPLLLD